MYVFELKCGYFASSKQFYVSVENALKLFSNDTKEKNSIITDLYSAYAKGIENVKNDGIKIKN